jgi:predicted cupin superfamily sugar epimerase
LISKSSESELKKSAEYWIKELQLQPHVEGGYFRETYRAEEGIRKEHLPPRYGSDRPFSTAIYFLLKSSQVSKCHKLRSDEMWHYYDGSPMTLHIIDLKGALKQLNLGPSAGRGEHFQAVVRAGWWLGAEVAEPESYCLAGCTVAPGFDFEDFELGRRDPLLTAYPAHREIILKLTSET